jgi:hypothetical protein
MKKPKKIKYTGKIGEPDFSSVAGYNQACDDWEKWLPSEEEIKHLALGIYGVDVDIHNHIRLAKTISKRLGGK